MHQLTSWFVTARKQNEAMMVATIATNCVLQHLSKSQLGLNCETFQVKGK